MQLSHPSSVYHKVDPSFYNGLKEKICFVCFMVSFNVSVNNFSAGSNHILGLNQNYGVLMCLAHGHNPATIGFKPLTSTYSQYTMLTSPRLFHTEEAHTSRQ